MVADLPVADVDRLLLTVTEVTGPGTGPCQVADLDHADALRLLRVATGVCMYRIVGSLMS